jgi:hypothetical protein
MVVVESPKIRENRTKHLIYKEFVAFETSVEPTL